jgi:hypothetical protein
MNFQELKVKELQEKLKSLNLPYYGKKSILIERLENHYNNEKSTTTNEPDLLPMDDDQIEEIPSHSAPISQKSNAEKGARESGKNYLFVKCFESKSEAEEFIDNGNVWTKANKTKTKEGEKRWYKCKYKNSSNCNASLCLLYHATDTNITLSRSVIDHVQHIDPSRGLSTEIKEQIVQLYQNKITKPKSIQESLSESFPKYFPNIIQINNFYLIIVKKYGESVVCAGFI